MTLESLNQPNLYKGPSSSKEFNERNRVIRKDMNRLYDLLNDNEKRIEENMDVSLRENFFLQNHILTLTAEVKKLKRMMEEESTSFDEDATNTLIENFYQTKHMVDDMDSNKRAYIDRVHGVATPMATNITSKMSYETEAGYVFLPKGLEFFLKEAKNTERDEDGSLVYYDIDSSKAKHIADKKKDSLWIREVSFPTKDSVTEVFGELHIKLPTEGLMNLYANSLSLHPYPEGSMRIRDIQYKGIGNQWSRLENYPLEEVDGDWVPKVIDNARKLLLQFNRTEVTELRIFYSQPYWFENQAMSTFTYGFQSVDLEYRLYTEKRCEIITKLDVTAEQKLLSRIEEPVLIPAPGTPQDLLDLVEHKLYYDENMEDEFDFNARILPSLSAAYIKTILKKQGDTVPVIKEIHVPYSFKEMD